MILTRRARHVVAAKVAGIFLCIQTASAQMPLISSRECLIDASLKVKVGAPVPGLIAEVKADRGDVVQKGQFIARLESGLEEALLAIAEHRAKNDMAVTSSKAQSEFRRRRSERMQKLVETKAASIAQADEAETESAVAKATARDAQLTSEANKLEATRARVQLEQRRILSPVDGIVLERARAAGEYRHEQSHIFTIARIDPLNVEVFLPISAYPSLAVGNVARVEPEAPINGSYEAVVTVIDKIFDASSGTFGVRLSMPNPGNRLPAGLRCKVHFNGEAHAGLQPAPAGTAQR